MKLQPKFVKLTAEDKSPLWVNAEYIVYMHRDVARNITVLLFNAPGTIEPYRNVIETAAEINKMIHE